MWTAGQVDRYDEAVALRNFQARLKRIYDMIIWRKMCITFLGLGDLKSSIVTDWKMKLKWIILYLLFRAS